ncbi:MAG: hypothetical protein U0X76_05500 [Bacteroidia bacterium]
MKKEIHFLFASLLNLGFLISSSSCHSNDQTEQSSNSTQVTTSITASSVVDSATEKKAQLKAIYTQAIDEFIKAANKKNKRDFDTLYFGKHVYGQPDDFPDIDLPATIGNTEIRLVTPEEGLKLQAARKSLVYVNLIGWVNESDADFIFVVFTNGAEHQYDYKLHFTVLSREKQYKLEKIEFENYLK